MRIAISIDDKNGLNSIVSPHFGRCPHFLLVDLEAGQVGGVQAVDNPFFGNHQPGQVPAFIHSLGADVMLTGGMGGRAIMFFRQYGIEGVTGAFGTAHQALQHYLAGQLTGAEACRESHDHGHGDIQQEGHFEHDAAGRLGEEAETLRRQLEEMHRRLDRLSQ